MRKNIEISIDIFVILVVLGAGISASLGGRGTTDVFNGNDANETLPPMDFPEEENVTTLLPVSETESPSQSPSQFLLYDPPLEEYCQQLTQPPPQQDAWWRPHRNDALQRSIELVLDVKLLNTQSSSSDTLLLVVEQITTAMNQYMVPLLIGCRSIQQQQDEELDRSAYAISNATVVHGHGAPSFQENNQLQQQEAQEEMHRIILTIHCLLQGYEDNDWILERIKQSLPPQEEDLITTLNLTDLQSLSVVGLLPTRAASLKSILGQELQRLVSDDVKFELHPQAFYWLAELDSWKKDSVTQETNYTWISRYVLAILYYENVFVGDVVNQTDNGTSRFATWLSSAENVCQWSGLDCNDEGILTRLYLDYDELTGPLPSELGLLTHLTYLNLYENQLNGPIPTEIGKLTELKAMLLAGNLLTGEIPSQLGRLSSLTRLSLPSNNFSGPIPTEVGQLTGLVAMFLNDNRLSGTVPKEIGRLTALTRLRMTSNDLTGSIPVEMRLLTDLTDLFLDENDFSGSIPFGIGALVGLNKLSFARNALTGTIPPSIGGLEALTELYLKGNNFSGAIPNEMRLLSNLRANMCEITTEGNRFNDTSGLPNVCT